MKLWTKRRKHGSANAIEYALKRTGSGHKADQGEVVLKDVTGYVPGVTVLRHVNAASRPEDSLCRVHGRGKTANLINRFYEIKRGEY